MPEAAAIAIIKLVNRAQLYMRDSILCTDSQILCMNDLYVSFYNSSYGYAAIAYKFTKFSISMPSLARVWAYTLVEL